MARIAGTGPAWRLLGLSAVLLLLASQPPLRAQAPAQQPPPSIASVLQKARECYAQGDFETAAKYYQQLRASAAELSPAERSDLERLIQQNELALRGRREGHEQLRQAEEALRQGRLQEARALYKALDANRYLTPQDRQAVIQLGQRLQTFGGGLTNPSLAGQAASASVLGQLPPNADVKTILSQARAALQRGDLDSAEQLALYAKQKDSGWHLPWSDTPAKVLRDVAAARARQAAQQQAGKSPSGTAIPGTKASQRARPQNAPQLAQATGATPQAPASGTAAVPGPGSGQAPTPAIPLTRQQATERARELVRQGYDALRRNDLEQARRLALEAQALHPDLKFWEDNPEKLLRDIARRSPAAAKTSSAPQSPAVSKNETNRADARTLLRQARELLERGQLDEAEKLCNQAATAPGASWGLFDRDTPDKLRRDIQSARLQRNREEAARLLAEGRRQLELGNLQKARELAQEAQAKHGPYTILDLGDRPDRLLADIEMAELKQRTTALPPPPPGEGIRPVAGPAQNAPGAPPGPADPRLLLAQQRIRSLLLEAIELEKKEQLLEARAKLLQAQETVRQAIPLGFRFQPGEETPESVLGRLSVACSKRVRALLAQADQQAALGAANPRHLDEALQSLEQARQLAAAFGQDLQPIQEKIAAVQRLRGPATAGAAPPGPPATAGAGTGKLDGKRLLEDARRELRAGQLQTARRMAEMAMDPAYGVQEEAARLLTSIDDEERNQKILVANRTADALFEAYTRQDYRQAALLYREINVNDLSPERRQRLREVLTTEAMQAALAGRPPAGRAAIGRATATDLAQTSPPAPAAPAAGGDDLQQYQLREQVLFQKLREEGLAVQAQALKTFQAGKPAAALEMLQDYLERLEPLPLSPEQLALLKRPVEQRLQQLRTLRAQMELQDEATLARHSGTPSAEARLALEKQRRQQTVAELLKRYDNLYKEGKYKECLMILAEARELDPENPTIKYAYDLAKYKDRITYLNQMKEQKEDFFLHQLDVYPGPSLDINQPLAFDKDGLARMQKRKPGPEGIFFPRHDEKERQIEQKLLEPTTVSFVNQPLQKTLDDLSIMHNLNIYIDKASLEQAGISLDQPVSLKVSNISLKSALNLLLKQAHLTYIIKDQVLQVTTEDNARGRFQQVVYPVTDLVVPVEDHALPAINDLSVLLQRLSDAQLMPIRGVAPYTPIGGLPAGQQVSPGGSLQEALNNGTAPPSFASQGSAQPQVNVRNPSKTLEENLIKLITTTIAPESWAEMGGKGTIQYYPLARGLVVNQTQDVQEQIADLLAALRRLQDLEVAIEVRLISVSESFFERMGLDFDLNIVTPTSSVEPLLTTGNFRPFPFVNRFTPSSFGPVGLTPAGTFTPDLNIPIKNSSFDFTVPPFGNYPGTLGADGGLTLGLAFLSDVQVFMLLEAAQGDQRTNTMQAPRVTVFNGQTATISISTFQFFLTGVTISTVADQLIFTPQNQPVPLGVNLIVQPVVTADRRFVRLFLNPQLTNLASANVPLIPVQIPVPQMFNDNFVNPQPVIFQMFFQQPTFEQIFVQTTVLVPDGGTVLLGGLKTLNEGRNEFGPPILSKIPYLNRLFKNVAYGRDARSLLIMVTPRIIINEEEEEIFTGAAPPLPRP